MKEIMWAVLVTSVILKCFGEVDAHSVRLVPSPIAEVKEGNALILNCSYSGSNNPDFINWYLNNDTFGLVIKASSCKYQTRPGQYEIDRYNISCHGTKFSLSIANISKDRDDQDTWKCDTTVIGMVPPLKASTTIRVINAAWEMISLLADKPSPKPGENVNILATVQNKWAITWMNNATGTVLAQCPDVAANCQSQVTSRYRFSYQGVNIIKFDWSEDAFVWKAQCGYATATYIFSKPNNNGQFDESKTEVVMWIVVGVISAFAVIIAAAGYFHYRKRRNGHDKKRTNREHHEGEEQNVMI